MALLVGMVPSGDVLGGTMAEVIAHFTAKLADADRDAISVYLASLSK